MPSTPESCDDGSGPVDAAPAWLHDGTSAARHDVTVRREGATLRIDGFGTVRLADLRRIEGHRLVFARAGLPGWRLGFDVEPPSPILWQLPAAGRYGGLIDRVGLWRTVAIGAILSALLLMGAIRGLDLLARLIPHRWERALGDVVAGDFGGYACRDSAGQKALDDLARRLSSSPRPVTGPVRVGVVDLPMVNAVALPGGRILLFRGLIEQASSADEVAGVLAHEIGHVEHRHVMIALLRRFGLGLLLGWGGGEYGQALLDARHGRTDESEADATAIERLVAAGISPAATARLFGRLGRGEADVPTVFAYLASHPPSAERKRRFDAAVARVPDPRPALAIADWRAVVAMCASRPAGGG